MSIHKSQEKQKMAASFSLSAGAGNLFGTLEKVNNTSTSTGIIASTALVKHKTERLMVEEMGTEMVTIFVGSEHVPFSVHKDLICATTKRFVALFNKPLGIGQRYSFEHDLPSAFKLFVEYLYTKHVPTVQGAGSSAVKMSARLRELLQLYAFVEKYQVEHEICNKVMDKIQDGFVTLDRDIEGPLVKLIFHNTVAKSKLREFALDGLLYAVSSKRAANTLDKSGLKDLLKSNDDALDQFLRVVLDSSTIKKNDPRIRDCGGEAGCAECSDGVERKLGVWPCLYHIHLEDSAEGQQLDAGCYLWNT